jgi:hypothetical protein
MGLKEQVDGRSGLVVLKSDVTYMLQVEYPCYSATGQIIPQGDSGLAKRSGSDF